MVSKLIFFLFFYLFFSDVRNHPLLIHCKRGKVCVIRPIFVSFLFRYLFLVSTLTTMFFVDLASASNWLPCGMLKKNAEMESTFYF